MTVEHGRPAPRRSGLHRFVLVLAIVAAALASLQPALGAPAFFRPSGSVDLDTIHLADVASTSLPEVNGRGGSPR